MNALAWRPCPNSDVNSKIRGCENAVKVGALIAKIRHILDGRVVVQSGHRQRSKNESIAHYAPDAGTACARDVEDPSKAFGRPRVNTSRTCQRATTSPIPSRIFRGSIITGAVHHGEVWRKRGRISRGGRQQTSPILRDHASSTSTRPDGARIAALPLGEEALLGSWTHPLLYLEQLRASYSKG